MATDGSTDRSTVAALRARVSGTGWLPLVPAVAFIVAFLAVPAAYIVLLGFWQFDPIEIVVRTFTLDNYAKLLGDPFYRQFVVYTIRISFVVTVVCLLLGYPVAYYLSRASPSLRSLVLFLVVLPLMVGTVVRTYAWIILLGSRGLVADLTGALLGQRVALLGSTTAVMIGLVGVLLPFLVLPVYSSLESMDDSLELAARNLGANKLKVFYKITLPLSVPGIVTGSIFVFALSMSAVITPKLLGGRTDVTIGALMYDTALGDTNWPFASAMATLMAVITLVMILTYMRLSRGGVEGST